RPPPGGGLRPRGPSRRESHREGPGPVRAPDVRGDPGAARGNPVPGPPGWTEALGAVADPHPRRLRGPAHRRRKAAGEEGRGAGTEAGIARRLPVAPLEGDPGRAPVRPFDPPRMTSRPGQV